MRRPTWLLRPPSTSLAAKSRLCKRHVASLPLFLSASTNPGSYPSYPTLAPNLPWLLVGPGKKDTFSGFWLFSSGVQPKTQAQNDMHKMIASGSLLCRRQRGDRYADG